MTMMPSGAIRNVVGMPGIASSSGGSPSSMYTGMEYSFSLRNAMIASERSSRATQIMAKFSRLFMASCNFWMEGISATQGAHHVAQKLMNRNFPENDSGGTGAPSSVCSAKGVERRARMMDG